MQQRSSCSRDASESSRPGLQPLQPQLLACCRQRVPPAPTPPESCSPSPQAIPEGLGAAANGVASLGHCGCGLGRWHCYSCFCPPTIAGADLAAVPKGSLAGRGSGRSAAQGVAAPGHSSMAGDVGAVTAVIHHCNMSKFFFSTKIHFFSTSV